MAVDDKKSIYEILDDKFEEEAEMMVNKIIERMENYYKIVEPSKVNSEDCTEAHLNAYDH